MDIVIYLAVGIAVYGLALQFGMRYVLQYTLSSDSVSFLLFGRVPIYQIALDDIEDLTVCDATEAYTPFAAFNARNRIWGNLLMLTKKDGLVRNIIFSPNEPDRYLDWFERSLKY